jgi:hypothetical protein
MLENNPKKSSLVREPKKEDFKNELEFDLARINYLFATKSPDQSLQNMLKSMESSLLCKLGMLISE